MIERGFKRSGHLKMPSFRWIDLVELFFARVVELVDTQVSEACA